ncbi:4Fe-4S dicluster domain-containing protein [Limimaricola cinnabarinus]|uniref:(Fe-S)-binding protein n=1 Tax=Limimaricola cinnabarinus TaxID=1125964 RepID=A0A2G1MJ98_9RHOB|nr:4Fe-4S dicluster domain-containing protein [Limimaricola cinnabarinus]PHP28700.1 (Fe-S)-binding protein [Limimaricola cinnabarinus]
MPKPNPYRPYQPDLAQMALRPAVSGNDINGLNNPDPHPPRLVYWAPDPDQIPHGEMQRWFYTVQPDAPALLAERAARQTILEAPLPEVAAEQVTRAPGEWTTLLDGFVESGLCEKTGVAEMQDEWCYEGRSVPQSRVIMLGVQHDYTRLSQAPEVEAGAEVIRQYGRAAHAAKQVAGWLRQEGWAAEPVTGPMTGDFTLIPPALACGFGELGKHGSIIDRVLGANFRLSAVLTDAPFAPTPPREHGIDAFCASCRICEDACPPEAIYAEKQQVRGAHKWYVDFDKCLPFFNEHHGCGICIAVCLWSRPGVGPSLAAKLTRRAKRHIE